MQETEGGEIEFEPAPLIQESEGGNIDNSDYLSLHEFLVKPQNVTFLK